MDHVTEQHPTVKCLIWDLDNTLWRGTLLEGDEVEIPPAVRDVVVELDSRGILQSVASRNDHTHAWERLEKLGLAEYFVLPRIGWGAKSVSVRAIADELNFALSAVAFIDDQPTERAEVEFHLPDVRCYPAEDALSLPTRPEFSPTVVTHDARRRREMYQAGFRRESERSEHSGTDEEFLRSLSLELRIEHAGDEEISRVEELTLRTSQMNATGVHYSDQDLRSLIVDERHEVLVASLTDRFGPHGAIGVILLERRPDADHIKLLATSCRVVSFGVGAALLRWLTDETARAGTTLTAAFRRTERNRMMEVAYRFAGFEDVPGRPDPAEDGAQTLLLKPSRQSAPPHLKVLAPRLFCPGRELIEWGTADG
ncbi:putative methoxymalonate biosynthesis protein (OzmB) [Streptomyces bingchenggensis BCW-1]|uniref:Putative methoxymalonate biosynthesis protein (OzmB) n=2 Tax=Streptomyces TaxID=1883 RepID=D7C9R4_STRBB|nr:putative methoxymalonate biosynthesis protein (OzmB) [Streptomyces bingchenggensis BCW-1]